jgi:hypothetical protein
MLSYTSKEAVMITGGLSSPGKMPCKSFNLPALVTCPIGRILASRENTSCTDCYALKGRYVFPNVKKAMKRRYDKVLFALSDKTGGRQVSWVEAMALLIRRQGQYFRWHDSGDVFSDEYMHLIIRVANKTPEVRHWIPTKEADRVDRFRGIIPENAIFRISTGVLYNEVTVPESPHQPRELVAHVVKFEKGHYGTVSSIKALANKRALLCLAKARADHGAEQACGDCRACWSPQIQAIVYPLH